MSEIVALKPHERKESRFYLDVYLQVVQSAPKELLQGAFGIALAEAMHREGITGRFRVLHELSSEIIRVSPEGPIIYSRGLYDRLLSGEILRIGERTKAYGLLRFAFIRDRRHPIVLPDEGPELVELPEEDPLGLKEEIFSRLRLIATYNGIDFIVAKRRRIAEELNLDLFEYEQAEKLVSDLAKGLLDESDELD